MKVQEEISQKNPLLLTKIFRFQALEHTSKSILVVLLVSLIGYKLTFLKDNWTHLHRQMRTQFQASRSIQKFFLANSPNNKAHLDNLTQ